MLCAAKKNHPIFKISIITLCLSLGSCVINDDAICPSQFMEDNFETGVFNYVVCKNMSLKQLDFYHYFVPSLDGFVIHNSSCTTSNSTQPALNSTYSFCSKMSISGCQLQFRRIVLQVIPLEDQSVINCLFEMTAYPEKLLVVAKAFRTNTSMEIYAAIPYEELTSWESVNLTCQRIDGSLCTDKFEYCEQVIQDVAKAKLDLDPNMTYSYYYKCVGNLTAPDVYKFQLSLEPTDDDVRVASPQRKSTNVSELAAVTCLEVMSIHQREIGRNQWVTNTQYADQLNLTIQFTPTRYDYFVEYFCESDDIEVCGNKTAVLASDRIPTLGDDKNFSVQYRDILLQTSPGATYRIVVKAKLGLESVIAWRSAQLVSQPPKPNVWQKIQDGVISSPGKPIHLTVTARSFEVPYILMVYCNSSTNGTCSDEPVESRVIEAVENVTNKAATWTEDIIIHLNFSTENLYNLEVKTESRGVYSDPWISPTYQGGVIIVNNTNPITNQNTEASSKSVTNISSETNTEKFSTQSVDWSSSAKLATSMETDGVFEPGSEVTVVTQTSPEEVPEKETVGRVDSSTASTKATMSVITTSTLKVAEETSPAPVTTDDTDLTTEDRKFTVEAVTSTVTRTEQITKAGTEKVAGEVKTKRKNKGIPFIIIGVVAAVAVAVGTAWYIRHRANRNKDVSDTSPGKSTEPPKETEKENESLPKEN